MRMLDIIVAIFSLFVSDGRADALRSTTPHLASAADARPHVAAAAIAGAVTRTRPAVLLAIADHESNYQRKEVTPEPGGRFSCGVMTPEPLTSRRACSEATSSLLAGYLAGARHLRAWIDMCRGSERCALRGYAGGWTLKCDGEDRHSRPCIAARWFEARAQHIERAARRINNSDEGGSS